MEFAREELLIKDKMNLLKNTTILVVGLGGVGGYVVESLARCGVGHLILVDYDVVDITNINRQIIATHQNIGKKKTTCFKERIQEINPNCLVDVIDTFYGKENRDCLFNSPIDYCMDCCDSLESKVILVEECFEREIPLISAMGCGNRLHPELFQIGPLKKTAYDPLAKKMRYLLKDKKELLNVDVIYSSEKPLEYQGKIGSIAYVPSVAGLLMTSFVINKILDL